MNRKHKPARKCHGCILNLGERCAVYEDPHERWHHSKCTSYNDEELYAKYKEDLEKHPPKEPKEHRKEVAKLHKTEEHHQGNKGRI